MSVHSDVSPAMPQRLAVTAIGLSLLSILLAPGARAEPVRDRSALFDPTALNAAAPHLKAPAKSAPAKSAPPARMVQQRSVDAPISSGLNAPSALDNSQSRRLQSLSEPVPVFTPNDRLPLANSPLGGLPNSTLGIETERQLKLEEIAKEGTPRYDEGRRKEGIPFIGLSIRAPTH